MNSTSKFNAKGPTVNINGSELWALSEDNLISASIGTFPTEEYERQLEFGIGK
ncbi:MAG: hypothetical protein IPI00_06920 [Flavobacteriales bacterium]|nr:hypothetical protein [Flavobacteriales bacterium]MBK6943686.1 hypothetical protein [Flavobacteriales bacterium]MBK7239898.1 hypothetical protein [Flavobacteriales bacterium]MBK7296939.1 hypothetical protein [Flavobacteriales bacterium]MBK9535782.1 hypothetical protein [Flavobacteriales bacterium]